MRKKVTDTVYKKVVEMVEKYQLINTKDCIAVEVSNDKNSIVLLECLLRLKEEGTIKFDLEYFVLEQKGSILEEITALLSDYKIHTYHRIKAENIEEVYTMVSETGCNVIALPNNYNDIVNMTFMTFMQRKEAATIHPKSDTKQLIHTVCIRPLCLVEECEIRSYLEKKGKDGSEAMTVFKQLSYLEEGLQYDQDTNAATYHFNVYERA